MLSKYINLGVVEKLHNVEDSDCVVEFIFSDLVRELLEQVYLHHIKIENRNILKNSFQKICE